VRAGAEPPGGQDGARRAAAYCSTLDGQGHVMAIVADTDLHPPGRADSQREVIRWCRDADPVGRHKPIRNQRHRSPTQPVMLLTSVWRANGQ
jgi:hypothetical protein